MGALKLGLATIRRALSGVVAPYAGAQTRSITYAARSCPSYTDVTANLARNNIQESLRDLGDDTDYVSGRRRSHRRSRSRGQPNCTPIVGWRFPLGDGIGSSSVGSLGIALAGLRPGRTEIVTQAAVPLRNANGDATGGRLRGAVNVNLTDAQADRATERAVGAGRRDRRPGAQRPLPRRLRLRRAALLGRQPQRRQRRDGRVPARRAPRLLLRLLRHAAADQRHDRGAQGGRRPEVTSNQDFRFTGNISYTVDHSFTLSARNGGPPPSRSSAARGPSTSRGPSRRSPPGWTQRDRLAAFGDRREYEHDDWRPGRQPSRSARATPSPAPTPTDTPPQAGLVLAKRHARRRRPLPLRDRRARQRHPDDHDDPRPACPSPARP